MDRADAQASAALADYAAKRAFDATPEPLNTPLLRSRGPLLFVVQQHAAGRLHYDFRLEVDGVLKSWAVPKGPSLDPSSKRMAVATEDHPLSYACFEGVIPAKQYGAGEVIVWDCGLYSPDEDGLYAFEDRSGAERRAARDLARGKLSFFLCGEKLKGSFALVRTKASRQWLLIKHRDRYAKPDAERDAPSTPAASMNEDRSVVSRLTLNELKRGATPEGVPLDRLIPSGPRERLPLKLPPMLAAPAVKLASDGKWLYEPKLDGYRVVAIVSRESTRLQSRNGIDLSAAFPEIAAELTAHAVTDLVLDGELLAFDASGRPSFDALQTRAQLKASGEISDARETTPCAFYVFDVLHVAGHNLREAMYVDRRRYLAQCLLPSEHVQIVPAEEDSDALYRAAIDAGFEGIVAKRKASLYESGRRTGAWQKIKAVQSADFVIGGYSAGEGAREGSIGALLLGQREQDGSLRYVGHVGTGFSASTRAMLQARLEPLATRKHPFTKKPVLNGATTWTRPVLTAEIKFAARTTAGHLRAPVFVRLRDELDVAPVVPAQRKRSRSPTASSQRVAPELQSVLDQLGESSKREKVVLELGEARIALTHLNKVLWPADLELATPARTKRDLLIYLARVSPYMLPHLADRPLTMIRMPEGIAGERFFQKHWDQTLPSFVETVTVFSESKNEDQRYLLCNNLATLLWLGQVGTLEFHIWHSRADTAPDAAGASVRYAGSIANLEGSILNYPDYIVFDIDPYIYSGREAPGAEPELNHPAFERSKDLAFWLKEILDVMTLPSLVKTSGKTGLHIFVPIERRLDFAEARHVSESVGRHLVRQHPRELTMEWSVRKRTGKVFLDHNMNVRGKTLNVAYSPRGVAGAPVSMPLTWDELAGAHPLDFTMTNALSRLALHGGDAWADALAAKCNLTDRLKLAPSS